MRYPLAWCNRNKAITALMFSSSSGSSKWPFIALLIGVVGIGFAPIFVRLSSLGPVATAFYRVLLALPVLLFVWRFMPATRGSVAVTTSIVWRDYVWLAVAGASFAFDLALWHWSITLTSVANATLFANFAPIFVTFGAWLFLGERITLKFIFALLFALLGAGVLLGVSISISLARLLGDGLALFAAIFYGVYLLVVSHLRDRFSAALIMTVSGVPAVLVLLATVLFAGESLWVPTFHAWLILFGVAWISHAGGQTLIAFAMAHLPATFSSLNLLLQPVIAACLAWWLLGETLNATHLFGAAMIIACIV